MIQGKKGQALATEWLKFSIILVVFVIMGVLASTFLVNMSTEMQSSGFFSSPILTSTLNYMDNSPLFFDILSGIVYFVIIIATLVGLYLTAPEEPIQFIVGYLAILFIATFQLILGYIADQILSDSVFSAVMNNMLFVPFFIDNYFLISLVYLFISAVAFHSER